MLQGMTAKSNKSDLLLSTETAIDSCSPVYTYLGKGRSAENMHRLTLQICGCLADTCNFLLCNLHCNYAFL